MAAHTPCVSHKGVIMNNEPKNASTTNFVIRAKRIRPIMELDNQLGSEKAYASMCPIANNTLTMTLHGVKSFDEEADSFVAENLRKMAFRHWKQNRR